LEAVYEDFRTFEYYNEDYQLYSITIPGEWDYVQERLYKGDKIEDKRRVYIHLYYNIDRAAEEQKNFDHRLMRMKQELISSKRDPEHESQYNRYFMVKSTPVRGIQVTVNETAVKGKTILWLLCAPEQQEDGLDHSTGAISKQGFGRKSFWRSKRETEPTSDVSVFRTESER
jgi:hypothetical protein